MARLEEWTLVDISLQRTVRLCEYSSMDTKLWHKDDCGDMFVQNPAFGLLAGHNCLVNGCYYHAQPPLNCQSTAFKFLKGLQEHCRRTHDSAQGFVSPAVQSQLHRNEDQGSVCSSNTMVSSIGTSKIPLNFVSQPDQPWLRDLDLSITDNYESVQCLNPGCSQYMRPGDPPPENSTEDFYLGNRAIGWCYSCFSSEPVLQSSNSELPLPQSGQSAEMRSNSMLSISNAYAATPPHTSNPFEDTTQIELGTTSANISSLSGDLLKPR